ncbi:MAG: MraY family glycosyltransferase [Bryobacteraceae bacterium]
MEPFLTLILILALSSFLFSTLLTPLFRAILNRLGLVDQPDSRRKLHPHPVPRGGGAPILLSWAAAYGLLLLLPGSAGSSFVNDHAQLVWTILPCALLVFATGLWDDFQNIRPWQKLAGTTLAAALAYSQGLQIHAVAGYPTHSWWSLPLTVLWLVACANAFNLIDGLDGLASGLGLLAALTMLLAACLQSNREMIVATVPLAGALIGFLRYNFRPASIFLGDSGSLLIGFVLGCCGVAWSQKSATVVAMMAPPMLLAIPLADAALAVFRRFIRCQPVFLGDRGHIHHRLLDRGLSQRRVILLLYAAFLVSAGFSLVQALGRGESGAMLLCLFAAVMLWCIRYLNYRELAAVFHLVAAGEWKQRLQHRLWLDQMESKLAGAISVDDLWVSVQSASAYLGCRGAELSVGNRRLVSPAPEDSQALEMRLNFEEGSLILYADSMAEIPSDAMGPYLVAFEQRMRTAPFGALAAAIPPASLAALHNALHQQEPARLFTSPQP